MTANKRTAASGSVEQTIEQLQQRFEQLNRQKIQAETKHEAAQQALQRLKHEAREKYGTDDVSQLQEKLAAMQAENERKRAQYQTDLDKIEIELTAIEARFQAAENAGGNGDK